MGMTPSYHVFLAHGTTGFLLHLTKERQEMEEWEERTSQPQVAFLVGATSSVALGPIEQAHQGSAFCPLTCDPELVTCHLLLSLQPRR